MAVYLGSFGKTYLILNTRLGKPITCSNSLWNAYCGTYPKRNWSIHTSAFLTCDEPGHRRIYRNQASTSLQNITFRYVGADVFKGQIKVLLWHHVNVKNINIYNSLYKHINAVIYNKCPFNPCPYSHKQSQPRKGHTNCVMKSPIGSIDIAVYQTQW